MPVFVAYGAARKLAATPIFAMVAAAGLVYPDFITLLAGEEPVSILNIPVMAVKYNSTLLPVLLGVGMIAVTYMLGITILGQVGDFAGSYVVNIFLWSADSGYDVLFRPAYLLHNMAEGGACLGVGLRAKDKIFKAECFSLAFGCIVAGVTEPAIYGVNLPLKKAMAAAVTFALGFDESEINH